MGLLLERQALHDLAVDKLDLVPRDRMALVIFTIAIADGTPFGWLFELCTLGAFVGAGAALAGQALSLNRGRRWRAARG